MDTNFGAPAALPNVTPASLVPLSPDLGQVQSADEAGTLWSVTAWHLLEIRLGAEDKRRGWGGRWAPTLLSGA